jgi:hypothetical protein
MRSTRRDLDGVVAKFEGWRARRQGRAMPDELWDAAIRLLDMYTASAICRALGLNPARFKQMREARGVSVGGRVARRRAADKAVARREGGGFVELSPPRLALGGGMAPSAERMHGATGCRLTLESAAGTLSVVTAAAGSGLVEAVCRLVLGALEDSSRL